MELKQIQSLTNSWEVAGMGGGMMQGGQMPQGQQGGMQGQGRQR